MVRIKTGVLRLPRAGQIFAGDGSFRKNPDRGDRFPGGWGIMRTGRGAKRSRSNGLSQNLKLKKNEIHFLFL